MTQSILKGRLDGKQRNKLKGLFDMMYSPRELAEEVGFHIDQVYAVYVPMGCPHERDKKNHILINGEAFAEWYSKVYVKTKMAQDETFCLTCKKGVKIINPKEHRNKDIVFLLSDCPVCGRHNLTKIIDKKRRVDDF
ncbi:MAG: hypothetical protein J0L96_14760 [Anaerolineae bacterium]|nr:hypothetical protein [Anaerolineae bacterium]